jgi:hypothetical protein
MFMKLAKDLQKEESKFGIKPSSEALRVKYTYRRYMLLEVPNKYFSSLHSGVASKILEFLNKILC